MSDYITMEIKYKPCLVKEAKAIIKKFEIPNGQHDPEYNIENLREGIDNLAKIIIESDLEIGLNDRWFRYYATDKSLSRWVAGDGSVLEHTLACMILDRYEDGTFAKDLMDHEEVSIPDLEYFLAHRK